jgi:hypothetical protein
VHRRDSADALIQYQAKQDLVLGALQLFQAEASFLERLVWTASKRFSI